MSPGEQAGAEGPRRRRCGRSRERGRRRLLQGAGRRARSSHRASAGKGIITQADLDQYKARELAPIECDYRGYHVVSAPPPSSGGVVICEILNILEGYPLKDWGFRSAQAVHYQIEAMRHAYVDRNSYLGDPDFVKNPLDRLLDKALRGKASAPRSTRQQGRRLEGPEARRRRRTKAATRRTTRSSTATGNAVSVTYTLNDWFGAKVTAAGTGVLLNNEMDDFTAKVGVPNLYGLVQGEANAIAPGKRPLSSMSPTIVTKDGKPVMVVGTPGGSRIITAVLHTILNVIDYGMNVQEAVDAPRFHQQWLPDVDQRRAVRASAPTRARSSRAWATCSAPPQPANHLAAILVGAPTLGGKPVGSNRFYGANDPRRNTGLALGY